MNRETIGKIPKMKGSGETAMPRESYTDKERLLIMMPLLVGGFISLLNETIFNVAFPQLMASLHISMSTIQWLATAYMLVIGILVPVTAFLIKTFSTRGLYLSAILLFTLGTILCGISNSFPALLISRIIQGAGTGMLLPIMMNTIIDIYPPEKRGAAMGISMMVVVAAPGIGPMLSGIILEYLDWHWLFFLILPFSFLALVTGVIFLKNSSVLTRPKIDLVSIVLSTLGFGGVLFGICSIENYGFFNVVVFGSLLIGLFSLAAFSWRQFSLEMPMLELRVFSYPMFALGTVVMFITFMLPFAVNIILPTYMQSVMGLSTLAAGLALLPGCFFNVVATPVSGHLFDRIGAKPLLISGFVALTVAIFFLARMTATTTLAVIIILQTCMTIGIGLISTPTQTNSLNQLPHEYRAHGVALLNTTQQIAAAFGSSLFIGLMGAIQTRHLAHLALPTIEQKQRAMLTGTNVAFTTVLIMVVIGFVLSFFIRHHRQEYCVAEQEELE